VVDSYIGGVGGGRIAFLSAFTVVEEAGEPELNDYQMRGGMRVPSYGEVGWYEGETLDLVWKGNLIDVQYQFASESVRAR